MYIIIGSVIFMLSAGVILLYYRNSALKKELSVLKDQQSAQESFLVTLVHDLKTPTVSQLSAIKMLEGGTFGALNSEQREVMELMSGSCKYMANLIGMILKSYSDFGKISLNKTRFNIADLVTELCEETKSLRAEKKQVINLQKLSEDCFIYADKLQIKRVILNLLSNAVTYGFCNTVINININVSKNSFEFFLENVSKQIPQEELCRVFDKYYKTRDSYFNTSGTGLGLYLVRQIVEKHNGRVYAKSSAAGICTFGFIMPNYMPSENEKSRLLLKKSAF